MRVNTRFFEAGITYKLCAFEVEEGSAWSPPDGSILIHVEPQVDDAGALYAMFMWLLVPERSVYEEQRDLG